MMLFLPELLVVDLEDVEDLCGDADSVGLLRQVRPRRQVQLLHFKAK